jgi:hypothetical protein
VEVLELSDVPCETSAKAIVATTMTIIIVSTATLVAIALCRCIEVGVYDEEF